MDHTPDRQILHHRKETALTCSGYLTLVHVRVHTLHMTRGPINMVASKTRPAKETLEGRQVLVDSQWCVVLVLEYSQIVRFPFKDLPRCGVTRVHAALKSLFLDCLVCNLD